jgi:hypothetical protein
MEAVEALGGKWCWGCFVCAVRALFYFIFLFGSFADGHSFFLLLLIGMRETV